MATPTEAWIASLLNLSNEDKAAHAEVINDFFAQERLSEDTESEESDDESDVDSDECTFSPVTDTAALVLPPSFPSLEPEREPQAAPTIDKPLCQCKLNDDGPCYRLFPASVLTDTRLHYQSLTHEELDIALMAKIEAVIQSSEQTQRSKHKEQTKRVRTRNAYTFMGKRVCKDLFQFIHFVGSQKLEELTKHFKMYGVSARQHKNTKRLPPKALTYKQIETVVNFITNYADTFAITLPGRTPHHWVTNTRLLPTNCTKHLVYTAYADSFTGADDTKVSERSFNRLWQDLLPFISTMKPATDLCFTCQKGATKVARAKHLGEEVKSAALREFEEHLETVTKERSFYKTICDEVKAQIPSNLNLGHHDPCSFQGKCHYSFDFAQQVMYPSNPLQPGPIYFKTPRKCGLFGVNSEAHTRQVNFLIDEACSTGKGANCVISLLHFFYRITDWGKLRCIFMPTIAVAKTKIRLCCGTCFGV
ncbi:hypothetical protein RRG08_003784 [Elysia crispata]|uniref:Uncharacterized protein n=1 Tax=Elysia crispata TaxID=231223 RepID=A0AAE1E512_9GAST|nr:hypothetical protein RRG08_003784 [Elysia crispata]